MESFFCIIEIDRVDNEQGDPVAAGDFIPLVIGHTRVVHYPDCQQLITWLTHPGREYGNIRLLDNNTGQTVDEYPVADKLNGSIQLLWDTLPVAPGAYTIEIAWKKRWKHRIHFTKYPEGHIPKAADVTEKKMEESTSVPVEYRDGFGKAIINEDLVLRDKLNKELADKFGRSIAYEGSFRAGTIIYTDPGARIEFYHEMGGGNCMFYIDIPKEEYWEVKTKTPLSSRTGILEYVAASVQAEQAPNCRYEIKNDTISYYYE